MLIPASVLGFFCFIYGIGTLHSDTYRQVSRFFNGEAFIDFNFRLNSGNVCADNGSHIMCPLCSEVCQYWSLNSTCTLSKFTYVFDNDATIVFAVLMSFWGKFVHFFLKIFELDLSQSRI